MFYLARKTICFVYTLHIYEPHHMHYGFYEPPHIRITKFMDRPIFTLQTL